MQKTTPLILPIVAIALAATLGPVAPETTASDDDSKLDANHVVAFYFHGNVRCATCRKIESYADEAIHGGFAEQLEKGTLVWRTVNVDEPEHEHFVDDFQLVTRSVVLAEYRDGAVVRYSNLEKVWQLVRSRDDFINYVRSETDGFLGDG